MDNVKLGITKYKIELLFCKESLWDVVKTDRPEQNEGNC